MQIRTYQAEDMAKALAMVRRELGRDAVILSTRTFRKGGFLWFGGRQMVEITATRGVNVLHPAQRRNLLSSGGTLEARTGCLEVSPKEQKESEELKQELTLVKKMVEELLHENKKRSYPSVPEELFSTYLELINQEVAEELANDIVERVKQTLSGQDLTDRKKVKDAFVKVIEQMIPAAAGIEAGSPGNPRIIALVGPTGVGKTTTIAKLAANFKLRENKKVGLITIDTYRIAAVDQLRTYANIINVPLEVVLSTSELKAAIDRMKDNHIIFIDTAGRSQKDELKIRELKAFLDAAKPDEIHLVISTTASEKNILENLRRFSVLDINRIILTKLDEAVGMGVLLNIMPKLDRAISYITTGQNVPDDIEPTTASRLARLLIDLESIRL